MLLIFLSVQVFFHCGEAPDLIFVAKEPDITFINSKIIHNLKYIHNFEPQISFYRDFAIKSNSSLYYCLILIKSV